MKLFERMTKLMAALHSIGASSAVVSMKSIECVEYEKDDAALSYGDSEVHITITVTLPDDRVMNEPLFDQLLNVIDKPQEGNEDVQLRVTRVGDQLMLTAKYVLVIN